MKLGLNQLQFLAKKFSPQAALPQRVQQCRCGSSDIIEDVNEGHVVCTQCGTIQPSLVTESAFTDVKVMSGTVSKYVVHRYSRWTYLRSIILAEMGETQLQIEEIHLQVIQNYAKETNSCSVNSVKGAIRKRHLPYRLMRHAPTIALRLWKGQAQVRNLSISQSELERLCLRFREFENVWDSARSVALRNGRKSFPSYRKLFRSLAEDCDFPHLTDFFPGMKREKTDKQQADLIQNIKALI